MSFIRITISLLKEKKRKKSPCNKLNSVQTYFWLKIKRFCVYKHYANIYYVVILIFFLFFSWNFGKVETSGLIKSKKAFTNLDVKSLAKK